MAEASWQQIAYCVRVIMSSAHATYAGVRHSQWVFAGKDVIEGRFYKAVRLAGSLCAICLVCRTAFSMYWIVYCFSNLSDCFGSWKCLTICWAWVLGRTETQQTHAGPDVARMVCNIPEFPLFSSLFFSLSPISPLRCNTHTRIWWTINYLTWKIHRSYYYFHACFSSGTGICLTPRV